MVNGEKNVCVGGYLSSTAPVHSPSNVDLALIIDNSAGMVFEDRDSARLKSLRSVVSSALPGDRVGVVTFDAEAHQLLWMRPAEARDIIRWAFLHGLSRFDATGRDRYLHRPAHSL